MTAPTAPTAPTEPQPEAPALRARIGIGMMLLSGVFWFALLAVPFLPLSVAQKSAAGAGLFIATQAAWWIGAAIAGPATLRRLLGYARKLWPVRQKPSADAGSDSEHDDSVGAAPPSA